MVSILTLDRLFVCIHDGYVDSGVFLGFDDPFGNVGTDVDLK